MKKKLDPLFVVASDNWLNEIAVLHKYSTYKWNKRVVQFLNEQFGHYRVSKIQRENIQRLVTKMAEDVSLGYIKLHITVLKSIMEYVDDDWMFPRIRYPKRSTRKRQEFYMFDEVRELLRVAEGSNKVLIMVLAETGCRLGEALALKGTDVTPSSINIDKNVYEGVLQDSPKTVNSIRKVAISDTLWYSINSIVDEDKFLFRSATGRPAWPQQLTYQFRETCKKANVPYKAFHAFRRGNITQLLNDLGMPERIVGGRVGHLSEGMTLGVYCKVIEGSDKIWVPSIESLLYKGYVPENLNVYVRR